MKNLLFLSPNQPPSSLQQRFSSSYAQDIVTDFEPPECMNYTENQWTAFVKRRLLDISPYLCSPGSTSRTWAPVFLHEDDFLLSSSSFAGWLNLLYNLYLVIALWSFEELWFWHWKTLLCNTWFSTGRGRLDGKSLACSMVADEICSLLLDVGLCDSIFEQHFPLEARQLLS